MLPFEVRVFDRMIFDMNRKPLDGRIERRPFGHCPRFQRAADLDAQVVMQPPRRVPLDAETPPFDRS